MATRTRTEPVHLSLAVPCHTGSFLPRPQGSFRCGPCKTGYVGDQRRGCKPERACSNGLPDPCHPNAECIVHRDGTIECRVNMRLRSVPTPSRLWRDMCVPPSQCGVGWAGNGYLCGSDVDIDAFPDEKLSCSERNCNKASVLGVVPRRLPLTMTLKPPRYFFFRIIA